MVIMLNGESEEYLLGAFFFLSLSSTLSFNVNHTVFAFHFLFVKI